MIGGSSKRLSSPGCPALSHHLICRRSATLEIVQAKGPHGPDRSRSRRNRTQAAELARTLLANNSQLQEIDEVMELVGTVL
jgi:hypothetical protein